jgi:hypothetical protein
VRRFVPPVPAAEVVAAEVATEAAVPAAATEAP